MCKYLAFVGLKDIKWESKNKRKINERKVKLYRIGEGE